VTRVAVGSTRGGGGAGRGGSGVFFATPLLDKVPVAARNPVLPPPCAATVARVAPVLAKKSPH
jgi:hypothetical protein